MATRKRSIHPRKQPKTGTGSAINDAILDAAERVLAEGFEQFTTNRVARRAGVSIGSLYQYFPNKEAILAELARRLERRTQALITRQLSESSGREIRDVVAAIVDVLISEQLGQLAMRSELRKFVPAQWVLSTSGDVDRGVRSALATAFDLHPLVRRGNVNLMAWVIGHAIEMVVESAVLGDPDLLESPDFRQELITLAVRYLEA